MKKILSLFLASTSFLTISAHGVLQIVLDPENDTLYFDGSVSGTTSGTGSLSWAIDLGFDVLANGDIASDLVEGSSNALSLSAIGGSDFDPSIDDLELLQTDDTLRLAFHALSSSTTYTITGNPSAILDYSSVNDIIKDEMESFASSNTTFTGILGSDHGTIQLIAVPEPSAYAACLGMAALMMIWYRRRKITA